MPVRKVKDRLYITDEIQYKEISELIDYLTEKRKLYPDAYIKIESKYARDYDNGYDDGVTTSQIALVFERDETNEERRRRINEKRAANKRRRDNAKKVEEEARRIAKAIQECERAELLSLANKIGAKVTFE